MQCAPNADGDKSSSTSGDSSDVPSGCFVDGVRACWSSGGGGDSDAPVGCSVVISSTMVKIGRAVIATRSQLGELCTYVPKNGQQRLIYVQDGFNHNKNRLEGEDADAISGTTRALVLYIISCANEILRRGFQLWVDEDVI